MGAMIVDEFSHRGVFCPCFRVGATEDLKVDFHLLINSFGFSTHPSVQIHVRYEDNMMTMCCLGRPSGHPADGTMYTMLTGQPDNIK